MSREWNDEELIRFCAAGPFEDVPVELIDSLRARSRENPALRTAIEQSPRRDWINEHIGVPSLDRAPSRLAGLFLAMVAVACLIVGIWIGQVAFRSPEEKPLQPEISQRDDDSNNRDGSDRQSGTANENPGDRPLVAAESSSREMKTDAADSPVKSAAIEKTESKPPVPEVVVDELWKDALDLQKPPLALGVRVWSTPGSLGPDLFVPDTFRRWFAAIPGRPFTVNDERVDNRSFTTFDGQGRLRPQWVDSAVLRLSVYDVERCSLTFWQGNSGIRLMFFRHRQPQVWSAHRVLRPAQNAVPVVGELLTNDCGRWQMTQFGPVEFRFERGHLVMARGDVAILKVPMSAAPQDVILDARMKIRDLTMYRSDPLPEVESDRFRHEVGPNRLASARPADLAWKPKNLEGTAFRTTPVVGQSSDAAVELATTSAIKEITWASVEAPKTGLSELVFRVDHADPGTGIYFGNAAGLPQDRIGFVWDPIGGRIAVTLLHPGENAIEKQFDPNAFTPPFVGESQWFRLIVGVGVVSGWVSPDGVHWGWLGEVPYAGTGARHGTVGMFALPGAERRIRVSHFALHEMPLVAAVASPEHCQQVDIARFEPLEIRDIGSWLQQVVKTRPAAISLPEWRRACAVETLLAGSNVVLGQTLLSGLLSDGLFGDFDANRGLLGKSKVLEEAPQDAAETDSLTRDLKLLSEAALLYYVYDGTNAIHFSQMWHAAVEKFVASAELRAGDRQSVACTQAMQAMLVAPLWTGAVPLLTPTEAARRELTSLVGAGRSADVLQAIDRLVFWNTPSHPVQYWWSYADSIYNTVQWSELSSHKGLSPDEQTRRMSWPRRWKTMPAPLRHSLAQPLSKEAYNVMAEFQAAISGKAFADACQVIGAAGTGNLLGLLPDSHDDKLLVAFPNAVALAMSEHPELRSTMNEKFGAIGRLRVRQAMESGDAEVLEAARVQFFGTLAAAESERWLGDRALAGGHFAEARGHYRRAMLGFASNSQVVTQDMTDLQGRLQLASSMLGVTDNELLAANVAFGEQSLAKDQLAALLQDLIKSSGAVQSPVNQSTPSTMTQANLVAPIVPAMASYQLEAKGKFDGDLGEHVGHAASVETDWFSRQFAITVDGAVGFMSNRFQLTSVDLNTGVVRWNQQLGAEHGHAHHWPNVAMKPLVVGNWVFCRRLTKNGPELAAFDKNSGNPLWKFKPKSTIVSDPLLVQGRLQVFVSELAYAGPVDLRLVTLQAETGSPLSEVSVTRLFDDPQLQGHPCLAVAQDGLIYFSLSGVSGCCDAQGQSVWLRRQSWLPPAMDPYRYRRAFDVPLLIGDLVVVTQPGVPVIEALDQRSGRLRWTRSTPDLRRMLGLSEGRLLTETQSGIEALDLTSGRVAWRYQAADLLDAVLLPAPTVAAAAPPASGATPATAAPATTGTTPRILLSRMIDAPANTHVPCLVWIDASNGLESGFMPIDALADKEPRLGPILATPQVTWIFSGKGRTDGRRDMLALTATKGRSLVQSVDQTLWAGWLPEFQRATFVSNVAARPNLARRATPAALRDAFVKQLDGWLAIAPPSQPKEAGLRPDIKGQKDALAVLLSPRVLTDDQKAALASAPVDALRLVKQVKVPKVDDAVLKFRVGHEAGQKWQLIIEGGNCRVLSTIIDDQTAPSGWQDLQVSLSHLANTVTELTITCAPVTAPAPTWVYLANLEGLNVVTQP